MEMTKLQTAVLNVKTDHKSTLSKDHGTREINQERSKCQISAKVQLAFRNEQCICRNNVIFIDVTFHGQVVVDSPFSLAVVVIPLCQGDETVLLRCFITRQVSLFKLLQYDLTILKKVIIRKKIIKYNK